MFPILLILFIAVPIIEIGLFIQVGGMLGQKRRNNDEIGPDMITKVKDKAYE